MVGELQALLDGRPDEAGRTADFARQASSRLEGMADRADELGVRGVVEEVGDFARRRPALFLAGATFAGVLVGRMARAGKEAQSASNDTSSYELSATRERPSQMVDSISGVGTEVSGATYPSTTGLGTATMPSTGGLGPTATPSTGTSGWGVSE
jgi:hypothetical protein